MSKPVVFITGASTGIGSGLVRRFAETGYRVACCARRKQKLNDICKPLIDAGYEVLPIICDVQKKENMHEAVDLCFETYGQIDCFVANAGVSLPSHGHKLSSVVFDKTFATNVLGVIYGFEKVIPHFIKRRTGQLVSIGSLASYRGLPGASAYCSSKAALSSISESLRVDLRKYNVSVSLINPGFIKTPLTDKNRYVMPFLMPLNKGVDIIFKAIVTKKKIFAFPWQIAIPLRLSKLIPLWIYDSVIARFRNDKKKKFEK